MKGRVKVTEGYWRLNQPGVGPRVCRVTKDGDTFLLEYILYIRKENKTVIGTMLLEGGEPYWVPTPKPITEKEYFVAQLRGKP